MGAGEVDVTLDGSGSHGSVGASHASGHRLRDSAAAVADTKLVAANANNSAVVGARRAVSGALGRGTIGGGSRLGRGRLRLGLLSWGLRLGLRSRLGGSDRLVPIARSGSVRVAVRGLGRAVTLGRSAEGACAGTQLGHGSAATASGIRTGFGGRGANDRWASVGVLEVVVDGVGALSRRQVDGEHVRQGSEHRGDIGRTGSSPGAAHLDRSAVHVELSVANLVQPRPGESVLAVWKVGRHRDIDLGDVGIVGVLAGVLVVFRSTRAATNLGVDHLPLALFGRLGIGRDRELAAAASVGGTSDELDTLGLTSVPLVHLGDFVGAGRLLAGELADLQRKLLGAGILPLERNGVLHDDMGRSSGGERQKGGGLGEHVAEERVIG